MKRRIYLAALFSRKDEMAAYADQLKEDGHTITARWVYGGEDGLTRPQIAELDVHDVREANTVLLFTMPYGSLNKGGGRFTEFGIGLERKAECLVVGEREQIFCHHPEVKQFDTFEQARGYLKQ